MRIDIEVLESEGNRFISLAALSSFINGFREIGPLKPGADIILNQLEQLILKAAVIKLGRK